MAQRRGGYSQFYGGPGKTAPFLSDKKCVELSKIASGERGRQSGGHKVKPLIKIQCNVK
jgi:hypothetical protein